MDAVVVLLRALAAVVELVFTNCRCRRFVFDLSGRVLHLDVRNRVGPALFAEEQRIALRVVTGVFRRSQHLDQAAIRVLAAGG